jgi:hypothetical protein
MNELIIHNLYERIDIINIFPKCLLYKIKIYFILI